jgi:hypothetical protein
MTDIEPSAIQGSLEPTQPRTLDSSDLIGRVAADLTPLQLVLTGRKIAKDRAKTVVELAKIEDRCLLAKATEIAKAQIRSTEEQAERLLHAERMDCLASSALKYEEASRVIDLVKDEAAHSIFKDGLKAASARYVNGVVSRSGS